MLKKIIAGILIVACLAGGIYWFTYTKEVSTPIAEGINAIPGNAAIIFESKQAKNTWKKLSQTNIMWEELLGTETFAKLNTEAQYIDSVLNSNPTISGLLDDHSVLISAHVSEKNTVRFLYVYSLPNLTYQSGLEDFLEKVNNNHPLVYREFEGAEIGTVSTSGKAPLSFTFMNGTLIMSTQEALVQESVKQLQSGHSLATDNSFTKVLNTAGKNV